MKNFINKLVNAAHQFTGLDFAIFKICLLTIGILLGAYFSVFFLKYISIIWVVAIVTWCILIIKVIRYYKR